MSRSDYDSVASDFARRLRDIRGQRTVRAFAQHISMDPSEWSAFEKGRKRPSFTKLLEICEKVGKTPDELIYGSRFAPIPNTDSRQATMADRIELLARGLTSGLQGADEELVAAFERQIRQLKLPGRGGDKKRKRKSE